MSRQFRRTAIPRLIFIPFTLSLLIASLAIPQSMAFGLSSGSPDSNSRLPFTAQTPSDQPEPRRWHGQAPPEVDALVETLGQLTEQHNEVFAGVALSFDRQSVNVYTASANYATQAPDVAKLVENNSALVNIISVEHSKKELLTIEADATTNFGEGNVLTSSIDVTQNRVVLGVSPNSLNQARSVLSQSFNNNAIVLDAVTTTEDSVGRYDDYPRYYMGGAIQSNASACSAGLPVSVNGVRGLLTAGHCLGGRFTTPRGKFVGNEYTTAYPGNARKYGDWKILYGGSYAPNIFSGPANSSSAANYTISGIRKRQPGQEVCSSGRTTGEICRFVIETTDSYLTVNGVRSDRLTHTYHDGDRNGYSDCSGWQKGDSGGPVFAGSGTPGRVNAAGIVKGYYTNFLGKCRYSYTQFDGVTAWNSGVRLDR